jgi:hypothetical protein
MESMPASITPILETPGNLRETSMELLRRRPAEAGKPRLKMVRAYIRAPTAKIVTRQHTAMDVIEA